MNAMVKALIFTKMVISMRVSGKTIKDTEVESTHALQLNWRYFTVTNRINLAMKEKNSVILTKKVFLSTLNKESSPRQAVKHTNSPGLVSWGNVCPISFDFYQKCKQGHSLSALPRGLLGTTENVWKKTGL